MKGSKSSVFRILKILTSDFPAGDCRIFFCPDDGEKRKMGPGDDIQPGGVREGLRGEKWREDQMKFWETEGIEPGNPEGNCHQVCRKKRVKSRGIFQLNFKMITIK
ncbi:MAG: hypothetical protein ACTHMC_23415 [Pseudobacter sp.]|uniref:hypothetical protein n=1 Tax=Pseudobacter sp. TaxID=2045420 RepID=UPI003F8205A7